MRPPPKLVSCLAGKSLNKRNTVMILRYVAICTATFLAASALQGTSAHALSMQECGAKYKAAKDAGTLNGMKWNDFRNAQCGAAATAAPAPTAAQPPAPTTTKPAAAPMPV